MRKVAFISVTASVIALASQPAFSQAWIGQVVGDMMAQQAAAEERHRCMMGDPMEEAEVIEALAPTNATMQNYFAAMQSGDGIASDFFALDKKARWTLGDTSHREETLASARDPFATAGATLDPEPRTYVRSGMNALTHADWQVRDADGALIGTYSGFFVRKLGDWKLRQLTLTPASEYVEPVEQFCDEPGDVLPHRLEYTEFWKDSHERSVVKAEAKLAGHQEKLASAEAKLSEKPDSSSRQAKVAKAKERVAKWEEKLAERSVRLQEVTEEYRAARADKAAAEAKKEAAIAALASSSAASAP